jgi:hypothetical protein
MTYTEDGDRVTLEMNRADFERLLIMLSYAVGAALRAGARPMFWRWLGWINELNRTNPRFTPFEVPEEFKREA